MRGQALALALASLLLASCTAITNVDDFTFETEPCGPRPASCTGGREVAFAVRGFSITRLDAMGRREGFDLDGTDAPICDRTDFVSPDGTTGVDNDLAVLFEMYEELMGVDLQAQSRQAAISGGPVQVVVLSHVDDLANDDCIEVTRRTVVLPAGVTLADLDVDHDGLLDANLTFDYQTPDDRDPVACTTMGVVHARFPSTLFVLPGTTSEIRVDRVRMTLRVNETSPGTGLVGGSIRVDDLTTGLPRAVVEYIRTQADLDPSSRTARDCTSVSFALGLETVPVHLGMLVSMP